MSANAREKSSDDKDKDSLRDTRTGSRKSSVDAPTASSRARAKETVAARERKATSSATGPASHSFPEEWPQGTFDTSSEDANPETSELKRRDLLVEDVHEQGDSEESAVILASGEDSLSQRVHDPDHGNVASDVVTREFYCKFSENSLSISEIF